AWPALEIVTRLTSPSTQRSRSRSSPRTASRIARLTSLTARIRSPKAPGATSGLPAAPRSSGSASHAGSAHSGGRARVMCSNPRLVLACSGVDPDRIALVDEDRDLDDESAFGGRRLSGAGLGVAGEAG